MTQSGLNLAPYLSRGNLSVVSKKFICFITAISLYDVNQLSRLVSAIIIRVAVK